VYYINTLSYRVSVYSNIHIVKVYIVYSKSNITIHIDNCKMDFKRLIKCKVMSQLKPQRRNIAPSDQILIKKSLYEKFSDGIRGSGREEVYCGQ